MSFECETTKLWYNKYLYKVVIYNQSYHQPHSRYWRKRSISEEKTKEIEELEMFLKDKDVRTRREGYTFAVFTNEIDLVNTLQARFKEKIEEVWKPNPKKVHILKQPNTILVKEPARHPIRVTLNDKKISVDFSRWISANPDKVTIGNSAYKAIQRGWMTGGLYFYLRDDKILGLVNLMISQNIRRVDRLVCEA